MENSDYSREEGVFSFRFEYSHHTPSSTQHALRQAFLQSKAENKELAAEIAALKKQMARKELSWEQDKKKLLDERDSLVSTLSMIQNDMESRVKVLESAGPSQKQSDTECKQMDKKKEKKEVRSLKESLRCQQMETEKVKNSWKAEHDQVNEIKLSFDKIVQQFSAEWESRWLVRQEEVATELNAPQQDCEGKASQVIQEKDDGITGVMKEMMALVEDNLAKLRAINTEVHQSETEWQTKLKALEDRLGCELAAKDESFQKIQELQKQSREMEEKWLSEEEKWLGKEQEWFAKEDDWLAKEDDWLAKEENWLAKEEEQINKANRMEEEMKLLSQQNIELQELSSKTDKEKAKMRKEEKKAKKETEKRLKKERKKEEEREKKEKKENEKKEKERLKREKKENEEREKKEKKQRKKTEKTEKERKG